MTLRVAQRVHDLRRTMIREIFDAAPGDAINLGLGQPDLPSPPSVCDAGVAAIREGATGYTSTAGDPALRAAIAGTLAPFVQDPDQVVVTVGSQEAMFLVCLTMLDPHDEALYPDPGYPAYASVISLTGATPVSYPLHAQHGFGLRCDDLLARITDRTRLVILCAPSNPTGAYHDRREQERLVSELERRGIAWVSDEIYAGFRWKEGFVSPAELSREGGFVVSGLSKDASMTGWRIGWVAGPGEPLGRMVAAHQYLATCASSISQAAARAAFSGEGVAERKAIVERFRGRREQMGALLASIPGVRCTPPDGAFYYFVDVSVLGDDVELARRILERCKVITIPGQAFGSGGRGHLRISFAASEEQIDAGVRAIANELGGARRG